jgi:hypothetical protein
MKLKTSKKDILKYNGKVLRVGYCELQSLLNYQSPFAYSCGVYGWSCDYYNIDGVIISTGYTPIGDKVDYGLIKEYEKKAEKVRYHRTYKHTTIKRKLDALLNEFIAKAVQ